MPTKTEPAPSAQPAAAADPDTAPAPARRMWQYVFAAFSLVVAAVLHLREDVAFPAVQQAGVIGYLLAAPLVAGCASALDRPKRAARARGTLIVFHLAFIPLQFLFSFGNFEPLAGMVLSTVLLVLMKPRFPQLKRRTRKVWLMLHIGFSVSWLGLSLAMTVMAVAGLTADSHAVRHGAYELMHLFDLTVVIPSMALAVISGVVLSIGTPWGLVKHRWVLLKFAIALSLPTFAAFVESKWIRDLLKLTEEPSADPGGTGLALVICLAVYTLLLWAAVFLSVFKPGGRPRWGRRTADRARSDRADARTPQTPVTVADVRQVADGVITLDLRRTGGGDLPAWQPGAHIDLVLPSGTVRQYSLYGDCDDPAVHRIAVLREPGGRGGSAEVHTLRPGARLTVRGPRNNFPLADEAPAHLFIAGGIGITPFLPMIRRLDAEGADWRLLYRGRSRKAMAFADDLVRRYPDRVVVEASDTHPRPDLAGLLRGTPAGVAVYCCGPQSMLDAVMTAMRTACPHGRLHVERFAAGDRSGAGPDLPFEAELRRSGEVVQVPADRSLLSAIRDATPTLDASCEDGVCGSCATRVLGGTPAHRDDVLQPHERDRHDVIYPCVSRAHGTRIALDL
jgi:ferredoxin-NADP reductase